MYDTQIISKNSDSPLAQALLDYDTELKRFAGVVKKICNEHIESNKLVAEALNLQKEVLLNVNPADQE